MLNPPPNPPPLAWEQKETRVMVTKPVNVAVHFLSEGDLEFAVLQWARGRFSLTPDDDVRVDEYNGRISVTVTRDV